VAAAPVAPRPPARLTLDQPEIYDDDLKARYYRSPHRVNGVTVAEDPADKDPSIVDRWLGDQQQWQRTILAYLDSMAKNEDFLVHIGNAMRGSLLAGKPYPTAAAPSASVPATPADDRIDQLHFAVHQIEGQLQDVRMTLDEIRKLLEHGVPQSPVKTPPEAPPAVPPRSTSAPAKTARPAVPRRKRVKAPAATRRKRQAPR
jgi:hypothetical protein